MVYSDRDLDSTVARIVDFIKEAKERQVMVTV
jgi:hypothetical protein